MSIPADDKMVLMKVAHALCSDVTPSEALDFLKEVYRLGYLARKKESLRTTLTVELIKDAAHGQH